MSTADSNASETHLPPAGAMMRGYARAFSHYQARALDITKTVIEHMYRWQTEATKSYRVRVPTFPHIALSERLLLFRSATKPAAVNRRYVLLVGAPGAGKGTQAKLITQSLGLAHISSGDLFRDNIKRGTELGLLAKSFMDRGELVPDKVTVDMVVDVLTRPENAKGALLDGFPRTIPQAQALDRALTTTFKSGIGTVIYVKVETAELLNRLSGRWTCPMDGAIYHEVTQPPKIDGVCDFCGTRLSQRADDSRETAQNRLAIYFNQTAPLLDYYRNIGTLVEVDGQRPIAHVTTDISRILGF